MKSVPDGPDLQVSDRYEVRERIGVGGMGLVYRAYDREQARDVALKVMRKLEPAALLRFKREFRALSGFSHPNLVTLHELVSTEDQWFFTMELVEGQDFLEYVRGGRCGELLTSDTVLDSLSAPARGLVPCPPSPLSGAVIDTQTTIAQAGSARSMPASASNPSSSATSTAGSQGHFFAPMGVDATKPLFDQESSCPPLSEAAQFERLRDCLRQLTAGVTALHQAGMLHRDIKPSNVLVTDDGRLVLLDFGIVAEIAPRRWTKLESSTGRLVGTPAYMAPEQARGRAVDASADWYSVGVVMYEALCGRRPFPGRSRDVIKHKLRGEPPPSTKDVAPLVPDDLDRLTMGLLAHDVEDRLGGDELRRVLGTPDDTGHTSALQVPVLGSWTDALIGRDDHLHALREHYQDVRQGHSRTVLLHGASGMGKSALIDHFLTELEDDRRAVLLSGRCYERESVPYKALDSLLDGLSRFLYELPDGDVDSLVPTHCGALVRLFPVLRRVPAFHSAARREDDVQDPHELRLRAFEALRELWQRMGDRGLLVMHIDDGQWADLDSATLLASVLREPTPPVLLIVGYRSEQADTSPFLRVLRSSLLHANELEVGPLSADDATELSEVLLRQRGMTDVDRHAEAIARESAGNAFFIVGFPPI